MNIKARIFEVGTTLHTSNEYPDGVPCVLVDGDSVYCECPGSAGEQRAKYIAGLLNVAEMGARING